MNILITGGLSYVGGRLASFLKEQSYKEIRLSTSRSTDNAPLWVKDFALYQMDLSDTDTIKECLRQCQPDTVIHLGTINQQEAFQDPELANKVNVQGTQKLLESAVEHGCKRFIYFSTFQVYGQLSGTITEETPAQPNNPYAATKFEAENNIRSYGQSHGVQVLILRLANAFGYPMDIDVKTWHLAFNAFSRKCVTQGFIDIRSNQYRDFITLFDVVRAVHHFLSISPNDWKDGLFNLGGECCLSIVEVAQKVADIYQKHFGGKTIPVGAPTQPEDNRLDLFEYSIHKLKSTGFKLAGNMETEVVKTLELCQIFKEEQITNG